MHLEQSEPLRSRADAILLSFVPEPIQAIGSFLLDAAGIGLACLPRQREQQIADVQDDEKRQIKDLMNKYPSY